MWLIHAGGITDPGANYDTVIDAAVSNGWFGEPGPCGPINTAPVALE